MNDVRRWLIDYDSTLVDTQAAQIRALNEQFGTTYTHASFFDWDTELCIGKEHADYMWSEKGFFNEVLQANAEPIEGAIEGVLKLYNAGEQLMIVSDRHPKLYTVTRNWLDQQGLGFIRLLFTQSQYNADLTGKIGMNKLEAAQRFGLTHVIEDAPHHARAFSKVNTTEKIYLLDTPWNQRVEGPKITRVSGWPELTPKIDDMLRAESYEWVIA